jgi:hypothetical protein
LKWTGVVVAIGVIGVGIATIVFGGEAVAYDSPTYRVTSALGAIEIREYEPYIVAETTVDGGLEDAGNQGFRILAKYIFGDNRGSKKIAMTAPVAQAKVEGAKIAMTTPVTQEQTDGQYTVRFMMPSEFSRDQLPDPNDSRIAFQEIPSRTLAAVRYSGTWSQRNYEKNLALLYDTLRADGLEPTGEPVWARYNAPFTPWFMRRNEILTAFAPAD